MAKKKEMDNLAKDAAAALAAGMSYGRWKAMQDKPVVIDKPKTDELPEGWKVCPFCGKRFKPNKYGNGRQVYCCVEHQRAALRERNKDEYKEYYRSYMERKRAEQRGA